MCRIPLKVISGILLFLGLHSCGTPTSESDYQQDPWPFGVTYEIFVQSFADSDNDGIGDIQGMTAKLDYLEELGIQGVWLMPISPSPSYHKYDVTDYYGIHSDYGTLDDFKRFVAEAHHRNIRVIIDLVVNHCSSEHPWFLAAAGTPESEYRNYFIWADADSIRERIAKKETTLDSDNITQWHASEGNEEYYYGFFWGGMPDLNYDNPDVRSEIINIGEYWLEEIGVDGFRLDAARHIYPDDQAEDSHLWWTEFGDAMRAVKPDVYMVGEVWGNADEVAPYLQGLPSMFNFDFYHGLRRILMKEHDDGLVSNLVSARKTYKNINPDYIDAIFLNNHDQNRLLSDLGGDIRKLKLAAAILLTMPGMPYLYYGDEIGMLGKKPDPEIREPFLWDLAGRAGEQTSWIASKNSNDSTVLPLQAQLNDEGSVYNWFKTLIHFRNQEEAIRQGELSSVDYGEGLLAYERFTANQYFFIVHNLTGVDQQVALHQYPGLEMVLQSHSGMQVVDGKIILPPYSTAILKK